MLLATVSLAEAAKLTCVHLRLLVATLVGIEQIVASVRVLLLLVTHVSKKMLWCHVHWQLLL